MADGESPLAKALDPARAHEWEAKTETVGSFAAVPLVYFQCSKCRCRVTFDMLPAAIQNAMLSNPVRDDWLEANLDALANRKCEVADAQR